MTKTACALLCLLIAAALCGCVQRDIEFTGTIECISEGCIRVSGCSGASFDEAVVHISNQIELPENFIVGKKLKITALESIDETAPVQLTAVKLEDADD